MTSLHVDDVQLLAQFSQMFRTALDGFTDQVDMHRGQAMLLCAVVEKDGLTQSELAEQLRVQGATITNMLQKLEEGQFVIRRRDDEDNRLVRVYVTETGKDKERMLLEQFGHLEERILNGISKEDRTRLRQLVWQMIENMDSKE
jgi:DNA-binding MarR family transcriptional regulator